MRALTFARRQVRFYENGTTYDDPHNPCLSPTTVFDCIDSLNESGGGGRQSCHVCTPASPCLYDVLADPGETNNVAKANPSLVIQLSQQLSLYQNPYIFDATLTPGNLACYNTTGGTAAYWHNYTGPPCLGNTTVP